MNGAVRFPMVLATLACGAVLIGAHGAWAQKYGGILQAVIEGSPTSLSPHEEAAVDATWAMMPVYNGLVFYDPLKGQESLETIIPELAERWRWSDDRTQVTFSLRSGVRFHDGMPMTSRDVQYTFDTVRGASEKKLKLNPRRLWYFNIGQIVTNGDHEVTFNLKRPQPSLLAMLAAGVSPVYPAHIAPLELRTRAVGTGPFRLKEYQRDRFLLHEKNRDYFVAGRPYLDGVRYNIIRAGAARNAAMATRQLDIETPHQAGKAVMEALKSMAPGLQYVMTVPFSFNNIHFNPKKPPFNDLRLRQAVSMSLDRAAFIRVVTRDGVPGAFMLPPPSGVWGLTHDQMVLLPGYGDIEKSQEQARALMASLGYSAANPLKTRLTTRASKNYVDAAIWVVSQLKDIWIDAELHQVEGAEWYGTVAKREFQFALNASATAADDPDVNFYEHFGCGSQRNYSDYCDPEAQRLYGQQSQEFDPQKRKQIVWEIDKKLVTDVARIGFGFRYQFNPRWPYVKNLVPHQTAYSWGRMQEVWLDK